MQIELGRNSANQPVIWETTDNNNILVLGRSGQGKSVQLSLIANQMVQQGFHVIFLDSANEYGPSATGKPRSWPPSTARYLNVFSPMVPIATIFPNILDDGSLDRPEFEASRVAEIFKKTMKLRGRRQESYLSQIIQDRFQTFRHCSISALIEQMELDMLKKNHQAEALKCSFYNFRAFPEVDPEWYIPFDQPGATIIDTSCIMECIDQTTILEILMSNLWVHKKRSPEAAPMVIMLDECQNISFEKGLSAEKIIREGRKYKISGCFSTQWLDTNKGDGMKALGDAGLKIFFRPGDIAMKYALDQLSSKELGNKAEVRFDLTGLQPGEFLYRPDGGSVTWVNAKVDIARSCNTTQGDPPPYSSS